jgi:hypothetical protein
MKHIRIILTALTLLSNAHIKAAHLEYDDDALRFKDSEKPTCPKGYKKKESKHKIGDEKRHTCVRKDSHKRHKRHGHFLHKRKKHDNNQDYGHHHERHKHHVNGYHHSSDE